MHATRPSAYSIVLYDHDCPMCRAEIMRLKALDRHDRLRAVNIAHPEFVARAWGFELAQLSGALHVRTGGGEWLAGMPAIRHIYREVGLGWFVAPTGWRGLAPAFDRLYAWIARNRMAISRGLAFTPYKARGCSSGRCAVGDRRGRGRL